VQQQGNPFAKTIRDFAGGFEKLEEGGLALWDRIQIPLGTENARFPAYPSYGFGYEIEVGNPNVRIFADPDGRTDPTQEKFTGQKSRLAATGEVEDQPFYSLVADIPASLSGNIQLLVHKVPLLMKGTNRERNRAQAGGGDVTSEVEVDASALNTFPWTSSLIERPEGARGVLLLFNVTAQDIGVTSPSINFTFRADEDTTAMDDAMRYWHQQAAWSPNGPGLSAYHILFYFYPGGDGTGVSGDATTNFNIHAAPPPRMRAYLTVNDITSVTFSLSRIGLP